jgi:hypothetical protein
MEWSTTAELNVKEFVVERSTSGNYQSIGSVTARNSTGIQHYNFTDAHAVSGKSSYRLKIVDADAKLTYSKIASINRSTNSQFEVIPNPSVHGEIRIVGLANTNEQVMIKVFDLAGRLQLMKYVTSNGQDIVLKHRLLAGVYNLECIGNGGKRNRLVVVQ